jgi:hypothetical protein
VTTQAPGKDGPGQAWHPVINLSENGVHGTQNILKYHKMAPWEEDGRENDNLIIHQYKNQWI